MQGGDDEQTAAVHQPLDVPGGAPPAGTRIGDWVVGELIGAGGSSVVVAASRTADGLTQHAALKLLRRGAPDTGFIRRFRRERQILVGLRHPHIVRLLDGGATGAGRPWFAMDRITDGVPLTTWAATRSRAEGLRVVIAVCRAVDHAHQRLVVHCDLKPANVLVDPDGVPHVLDFGIARLLDDASDETGTVRLLTPRWAAPEQLSGAPISIAADTYALGLLLWAVLTGGSPREGLTGAALLGAGEAPVPPPSRLVPGCRGDLDAITLRATAVEPGDRYRSALALAEDLERHLAGAAVQAREGLLWYRTSRWIARHRALAAAAAVLCVLVVGWAGTATHQARSIAAERDRAREEAARAEATLDLLVGMLQAADPAVARGEELTVREALQSGIRELEVRHIEPQLAGEVRLALGRVLDASGDRPAARDAFDEALAQLRSAYPPDHPLVLQAALELAFAEANLSDHDPEHVAAAEAIVARMAVPRDQARGLRMLADLRAVQGELERAAVHARGAIAASSAAGDVRGAARARAILGFVEAQQGQGTATLQQALRETEEALGTRLHPEVSDILHELAQLTEGAEGLRLAEESIALRRQLYGEGWLLATTLNNYGIALESVDPEAAVAMMAEAGRMARATHGPDHDGVLHILINQGAVMVDVAGHEVEGLALLRSIAARPGLAPAERARALGHVGRVEARRGNAVLARQALTAALAEISPDHALWPRLQGTLSTLP